MYVALWDMLQICLDKSPILMESCVNMPVEFEKNTQKILRVLTRAAHGPKSPKIENSVKNSNFDGIPYKNGHRVRKKC